MYKYGTKVQVTHPSFLGIGIIISKIRLPKYPRGWETGYIVRLSGSGEEVPLYNSMIKKYE